MNNQGKMSINTLVGYSILILVMVVSTYLGVYLIKHLNNQTDEVEETIPININSDELSNLNIQVGNTELDNYNKMKDEKSINVISKRLDSPEFSATDVDANNKIALDFLRTNSKTIIVNGQISGGYLYVKAGAGSADDVGTIASNESVYIYLGSQGGHLYKPKSLTSIPTGDGLTQYLFKLSDISFTSIPYSDDNKSYLDNWLDRINSQKELFIGSFVSSASRFAVIEEITIAYEGEGSISVK